MPRVFDRRLRLDAKNRLENFYFLVRTLLEQEQSRDELFDGDVGGVIKEAVQETSDWLDENQLARKDEFEAWQKKLEGVVHPVMNEVRWREYERHTAAKGHGKGKSDEPLAEGWYQRMMAARAIALGPRQPMVPPPHHLLPAYGKGGKGGKGGSSSSSSSSSKPVSPYVR